MTENVRWRSLCEQGGQIRCHGPQSAWADAEGGLTKIAPWAFMLVPGATLYLNSFNQTIGSLTGAGNVTLGSNTTKSRRELPMLAVRYGQPITN